MAKDMRNDNEAHRLIQQLEEELNTIEQKFERSTDYLAASYDEYMKQAVPTPKFVPIRFTVTFQKKPALVFENLAVKPFASAEDLMA